MRMKSNLLAQEQRLFQVTQIRIMRINVLSR
nr:MAG TPA: hypothetical protein [Caudoviricetes sp.]